MILIVILIILIILYLCKRNNIIMKEGLDDNTFLKTPYGLGYFQIRSVETGECLDRDKVWNKNDKITSVCNASDNNQKWSYDNVAKNLYDFNGDCLVYNNDENKFVFNCNDKNIIEGKLSVVDDGTIRPLKNLTQCADVGSGLKLSGCDLTGNNNYQKFLFNQL